MKDQIYKYMPIVFGFLLGWVIFNPPTWLSSLGPLAYVVTGAIALLGLLSVVALIMLANLPTDLKLSRISEQAVTQDVRELGDGIQALGFRSVGPPLKVEIAPAATLLGFVHEKHPVYAAVYRTGTMPAKTSFDFVSILHGDRGGLTTNAEPLGAVLPAGNQSLRQVFPGAKPEQLFQRHLDGVAYLAEQRVSCRTVSADMFEQDFCMATSRQRELYLASPIVNTLVTLWRATTKKIPFVGSLRDQRIAAQQISKLQLD